MNGEPTFPKITTRVKSNVDIGKVRERKDIKLDYLQPVLNTPLQRIKDNAKKFFENTKTLKESEMLETEDSLMDNVNVKFDNGQASDTSSITSEHNTTTPLPDVLVN